jgi:hypothetical protein
MRKSERSPKAPSRRKGELLVSSNKRTRNDFDPGGGSREDIRHLTRRVNVPRHSKRPAERSNQKRSRV